MRPAKSVCSSGKDAVRSRKNLNMSRAWSNGYAINPPVIVGPTGYNRYSSAVATPKFPPPPRIPQKRSECCSALACSTSPSAVTSSADTRLSSARPYLLINQPSPPPSVRPEIPVVDTTPPVTAKPCSCVSRLSSAQVTPPWAMYCTAAPVDVNAFHERQVDHEPTLDGGSPCHVMCAAAYRDFQ